MRLVTERLRLRAATAAEHHRLALRHLVFGPVGVDQANRPGDLVGPVVPDLDLDWGVYSAGFGSSSAGGASGASGRTSGSSGRSVEEASGTSSGESSPSAPTPAATFLRFF